MRFSIFGFLIGRLIALNRGVPAGKATTDGFVAGVVRPPVLGIVLVSALARSQATSAVIAPSGSAPTLDQNNFLDPPNPRAASQVTVTGTNFGSDPTAIIVSFAFPAANPTVNTQVALAKDAAITIVAGETSFTMTLPGGLPAKGTDIGFAIIANGITSNTVTFQLQ